MLYIIKLILVGGIILAIYSALIQFVSYKLKLSDKTIFNKTIKEEKIKGK